MPNIGPAEILVILVIALLVFGPRKLPELGKSLGAGIREFRRGTAGLKEELEGSLRETSAASTAAPAQAAPAQTVAAQAVVPPVTLAPDSAPVTAQVAAPVSPQAVTPAPQSDPPRS